ADRRHLEAVTRAHDRARAAEDRVVVDQGSETFHETERREAVVWPGSGDVADHLTRGEVEGLGLHFALEVDVAVSKTQLDALRAIEGISDHPVNLALDLPEPVVLGDSNVAHFGRFEAAPESRNLARGQRPVPSVLEILVGHHRREIAAQSALRGADLE